VKFASTYRALLCLPSMELVSPSHPAIVYVAGSVNNIVHVNYGIPTVFVAVTQHVHECTRISLTTGTVFAAKLESNFTHTMAPSASGH
jgi:hypothetical protein